LEEFKGLGASTTGRKLQNFENTPPIKASLKVKGTLQKNFKTPRRRGPILRIKGNKN